MHRLNQFNISDLTFSKSLGETSTCACTHFMPSFINILY